MTPLDDQDVGLPASGTRLDDFKITCYQRYHVLGRRISRMATPAGHELAMRRQRPHRIIARAPLALSPPITPHDGRTNIIFARRPGRDAVSAAAGDEGDYTRPAAAGGCCRGAFRALEAPAAHGSSNYRAPLSLLRAATIGIEHFSPT